MDGSRSTSSNGLTYFRCPRCGWEAAREIVVMHWNEWGRVCYCPRLGTFDPHCDLFSEVAPGGGARPPVHGPS